MLAFNLIDENFQQLAVKDKWGPTQTSTIAAMI